MKFLHGISIAILYLLGIIKVFGGIGIHLYTVYLFFIVHGVLGGAISLFLPVLSQIFMGFKLVSYYGWNTLYPMMLIAYVLVHILSFVFALIVTYAEDKAIKKSLIKS